MRCCASALSSVARHQGARSVLPSHGGLGSVASCSSRLVVGTWTPLPACQLPRLLPHRRGYYSSSGPSRGDSSSRIAWQRRAAQLQKAHEADPRSPKKFGDLLRALNHCDPQQAIRAFERQEPQDALSNDSAVREYIRALVLANRLETVDLHRLLSRGGGLSAAHAYGGYSAPAASSASSGATTAFSASVGGAGGPNTVELKLDDKVPLQVTIAESHRRNLWKLIRTSSVMLILVAGVSVFAEGLAGGAQKGIGGSQKKIVPVEDTGTSFDDVKGCDEVKGELQEVIMYLKDPDRFTRLGAKLPKGLMMAGPPGTGKTLLARAIAGEAGVPFIQASGSEFEEMFVGVGARRIRDLFGEARKHAPCIIFIDEIDAVGAKRSTRDNNAVRMTLNQLLVELDGFEQNNGIVCICATNFPQSLDKALTRPGRLDKTIHVPVPDLKGRTEILEMYASKLILDPSVELFTLARRTAGMTGADLANILNIAAVRSSAEDLAAVPMKYLEEAFDRVVVGLERTNPMSDEEKRLTAYHEGGHTLVSMSSNVTDPVHKATIMPRGGALGITWSIPEKEKFSEKVCELTARLDVLMGGKAAEELIFGAENVTAGCTSDLQQATGLARRMVMNMGMAGESSKAPLYLDVNEYSVLSDEVKHDIDVKTQTLLSTAYANAHSCLQNREKELHMLADALIEFETLSNQEIKLACKGEREEIVRMRGLETERQQELIAQSKAEAEKRGQKKGTSKTDAAKPKEVPQAKDAEDAPSDDA